MPIQTETGNEFDTAEEALAFIRACSDTALDPGASLVETASAVTDMIYTFRALDSYLARDASVLPVSWSQAISSYTAELRNKPWPV